MTNERKVGGILALFVIVAVCIVSIAVVRTYVADKKNTANANAVSEPRVVKIKEVIGTVVGGPQIVSGSPLIGYAVYVKELGGMVALQAKQCPQLGNGQRVVMFQNDRLSEWYTFIRYE